MDYPHPLVTLKPTARSISRRCTPSVSARGTRSRSRSATRISHPPRTRPTALPKILDAGHKKDLRVHDESGHGGQSQVDQWSNGTDAATELNRMMAIRQARPLDVRRDRRSSAARRWRSSKKCWSRFTFTIDIRSKPPPRRLAGSLHLLDAWRRPAPVKFAAAAEQRAALDAILPRSSRRSWCCRRRS